MTPGLIGSTVVIVSMFYILCGVIIRDLMTRELSQESKITAWCLLIFSAAVGTGYGAYVLFGV
jgi:hypothetical protein